ATLVAPAHAHLDRGGAGPLAVPLVDDVVAAEPCRLLLEVVDHHVAQRLADRELVAGRDEREALAVGEDRVEGVHRVVGEPVELERGLVHVVDRHRAAYLGQPLNFGASRPEPSCFSVMPPNAVGESSPLSLAPLVVVLPPTTTGSKPLTT